MGAAVTAILRLPLASVVIALLLTASAGPSASPLIILAVVISHITADRLFARHTSTPESAAVPDHAGAPAGSELAQAKPASAP